MAIWKARIRSPIYLGKRRVEEQNCLLSCSAKCQAHEACTETTFSLARPVQFPCVSPPFMAEDDTEHKQDV